MSLKICPPGCADCAAQRILCLECYSQGKTTHLKGLSGHIQVHKMSLKDYRMKYTQDGSGGDVPVGWTLANACAIAATLGSQQTNTQTNGGVKQNDPLALVQNHLTTPEQDYFKSRYDVLFYQADSDPALVSAIRDIVMGEVNIARFQEQLAKITRNFASGGIKPIEAQKASALSKLIKDTQDTNLKLMSSLAITREAKQKAKKVIESTPSRYVSAYERIRKNFTDEQFKRAEVEEEEALVRLTRKAPDFEKIKKDPEEGA